MPCSPASSITSSSRRSTCLPLLKGDSNVKLVDYNPLGLQYTFRPNHLQKPFDNPKVRQALFYAFNQKDFLDATIGNPDYYKICKSMFPCGSTMASEKGMEGLLESNFQKSRELLKEANYDGSPIVLLHSTDLASLTNLAPVAKSLMEKGGFKVDMQSSDWQTVVARRVKKDPANAGGWHGMLTAWVSADILNPVMTGFVNASCDKAMFGWPCDAEIEKLRDDFARETDPAKQKAIAEAVQVREREIVTHIHLGQYYQPIGVRKTINGNPDRAGAGLLEHREEGPAPEPLRRPDPRVRRSGRSTAAGTRTEHARLYPAPACRHRAGDADRRGAGVPDVAADAGRSGRHHRGRQRQCRSDRRDPHAARPR